MSIILSSVELCLPLLLLVGLGTVLKKAGYLSDITIKEVCRLILNLFLPINIFMNIYTGDFKDSFSRGYVLLITGIFALTAVISVVLICFITKDKREKGAMIQGAVRGNLTLLAVPLVGQIASSEAVGLAAVMASLMSGVQSFYTVSAFEFNNEKAIKPLKLFIKVIRSPLIIATILGFLFVFFHIELPSVISSMCSYISKSVVAFSLVMIGASFTFSINTKKLNRIVFCVLFKTVVCPLIGVIIAILTGMNETQLIVTMCLFAAPCATSCFAQASGYDTDMEIISSVLVYSYVTCIFTLPMILSLMKFFGFIH